MQSMEFWHGIHLFDDSLVKVLPREIELYKDILCTDDCEVLNWVDRKIRGKLEGKIKLSKDKKIQPNTPDVIINNYYNLEANYEDVQW